MGASSWTARVPYQDDIGAALQRARHDAYHRGDFHRRKPDEFARSMSEQDYVAWGIAHLKAVFPDDDTWQPSGEQYRDEWRAAQVAVTDPDSLLAAQPFSGTHSVIDMTFVAGEPDYNAVAPAPAEDLKRLFGTTEPTVAAIETALSERRLDGFARWQGMYVIGHDEDGAPEEIFFVGWSGD